jgi:hypothetical protein
LFNRSVIGHERCVFDDGLGGEYAVESIVMFGFKNSGGDFCARLGWIGYD